MQPIVILDTNALYGRKPFTRANSALLLELSVQGHLKLIVPEVVLLELSRQWAEAMQEASATVRAGIKSLNETLVEFEIEQVALNLPEPARGVYYDYANKLFQTNRAQVLPPPEVSVRDLLTKEIEVRKPFARQGTGFRDALIWETIRELCGGLEDQRTPVVFVSDNHKDFCDKRDGSLHPDLRKDLAEDQGFDIVSSLHRLLDHEAIAPLVQKFRVLKETFTQARIEELVDNAISALYGVDIGTLLRVYIGQGMYEVPISTGLDEAVFEEILHDQNSIDSKIYRTGDNLTIRVTVDADCSFDGFIDKSDYYLHDGEVGYSILEDWNDYLFRASVQGRLGLTFSATFTEETRGEVVLSLDEVEEL